MIGLQFSDGLAMGCMIMKHYPTQFKFCHAYDSQLMVSVIDLQGDKKRSTIMISIELYPD